MKEEIKKLLDPHYGHLDFLLKIKSENVTIEDISILIELIKDKSLVSNLPKELHKYNSYYMLMKDFYFTKQNLFLIREIKDNLTSKPKKILLGCLGDDHIKSKLDKIFRDEQLKSVFLRWSGRIDDEFYYEYIDSVINDHKVWDSIHNEKSTLIELKDFNRHSKYIPSSWCIKNQATFYNYLKKNRIFIFKYNGKVYGVNVYKTDKRSVPRITIQDSKNNGVSQINNTRLYEDAKTELMKFNLFGCDEKKANRKIGNQKGIFRRLKDLFRKEEVEIPIIYQLNI